MPHCVFSSLLLLAVVLCGAASQSTHGDGRAIHVLEDKSATAGAQAAAAQALAVAERGAAAMVGRGTLRVEKSLSDEQRKVDDTESSLITKAEQAERTADREAAIAADVLNDTGDKQAQARQTRDPVLEAASKAEAAAAVSAGTERGIARSAERELDAADKENRELKKATQATNAISVDRREYHREERQARKATRDARREEKAARRASSPQAGPSATRHCAVPRSVKSLRVFSCTNRHRRWSPKRVKTVRCS